jgi:GT2 family glycosyltransferase
MIDQHGEIIVIDQSPEQPLQNDLEKIDKVQYYLLEAPNMVKARNMGIQIAKGDIIIFVDDDIKPLPGLISGHLSAYEDPSVGAVAGRIFEPGQEETDKIDRRALDPRNGLDFAHFNHNERIDVLTARGCNMSFRREVLMKLGGFDPCFKRIRDDSDMSFRVRAAGYRLIFEPTATLIHYSAKSGGTRGIDGQVSFIDAELNIYRLLFRHCKDDLYFILKHYKSIMQWQFIWKSYKNYVGFSRWPWRLLAKNLCFIAALGYSTYWTTISRPPYFPHIEEIAS